MWVFRKCRNLSRLLRHTSTSLHLAGSLSISLWQRRWQALYFKHLNIFICRVLPLCVYAACYKFTLLDEFGPFLYSSSPGEIYFLFFKYVPKEVCGFVCLYFVSFSVFCIFNIFSTFLCTCTSLCTRIPYIFAWVIFRASVLKQNSHISLKIFCNITWSIKVYVIKKKI